ncbi:hypothetical protein TNCV_2062081 [Trichonephila clavipes]|nr:hypothetical protein TNCV_2062081 [Trichonephila clavipes]
MQAKKPWKPSSPGCKLAVNLFSDGREEIRRSIDSTSHCKLPEVLSYAVSAANPELRKIAGARFCAVTVLLIMPIYVRCNPILAIYVAK